MPFSRPTLTALRKRVAGDIAAGLPGLDTLLRYANLRVIGDVLAGIANGLYGYLDYLARQMVPFTAKGEYLSGWAALKSIYIKEATAASGQISFVALGSNPVPEGTQITRLDGVAYVSTAEAMPSGNLVIVPVTASVAGANGNTPIGAAMYLSIGISGISPEGTVTTAISGGADIETPDEFRSRTMQAYQNPPSGGSSADYERWAMAVSGVTRAWCVRRGFGPGTTVVLFMMDDVRSAQNGFPQGTNGVAADETRDIEAAGDQLLVANALFPDQPADALVYAFAPGQNVVGLTIAGLSGASTDTRTRIAAAFASSLVSYGEPGGLTQLSLIEAAIASVSGSAGFVITSVSATAGTVTPGPTGNIQSNALALPVPGEIGYI